MTMGWFITGLRGVTAFHFHLSVGAEIMAKPSKGRGVGRAPLNGRSKGRSGGPAEPVGDSPEHKGEAAVNVVEHMPRDGANSKPGATLRMKEAIDRGIQQQKGDAAE